MKRRWRGIAGGVAALASTLPAQAYRTASDSLELMATGPVAWPNGVIEYVVHDREAQGISTQELLDETINAFQKWTMPECVDLTFVSRGVTRAPAASGDGVNTIQWLDELPLGTAVPADVAAVTDVQYVGSEKGQWYIQEADIYLNHADFEWSIAGSDAGESLRAVLLHEAGHMLGLLHPCETGARDGAPACDADSEFERAVMHPVYDSAKSELGEDDTAGACYLYPTTEGFVSCLETGCDEGEVCEDDVCKRPCGETSCGPGESCVSGECVVPDSECAIGNCRGQACSTSADCPGSKKCRNGTCRSGEGEPGDPCELVADCLDGACSGAGFCTTPCAEDLHCAAGSRCENGACFAQGRRALGAECTESNDCIGNQCVGGVADKPVCTRRCGEDYADCPGGWVCDQVEGRLVCIPAEPLRLASGRACSLGLRSGHTSVWALVILLICGAATRRKKNGRAHICARQFRSWRVRVK